MEETLKCIQHPSPHFTDKSTEASVMVHLPNPKLPTMLFILLLFILSLTWKYILNPQTRTAATWGRTKKAPPWFELCTPLWRSRYPGTAVAIAQLTSHRNGPDSSRNAAQRASSFLPFSTRQRRRQKPSFLIWGKRQSVRKSDLQSLKVY